MIPLALAIPQVSSTIISGIALGGALLAKYGGQYFLNSETSSMENNSLSSSNFTDISNDLDSDFSSISSNLEDLPVTLKSELSSMSSNIDNIVKNSSFEVPQFEQTHIASENLVDSVTSDNLLDILKDSSQNSDQLKEESLQVQNNIAESLGFIAVSLSNMTQLQSNNLSESIKTNKLLEVLSISSGSNLSTISHNLSLLPKLIKATEIQAQTSITDLKLKDRNNFLKTESTLQTAEIVNQSAIRNSHIEETALQTAKIANQSTIRNLHVEKTANLHEHELTAEYTATNGDVMTPIQAKTVHNIEKSIETSSSNKITLDDHLDMYDGDINIFQLLIDKLKLEV